MRQGPASFKGGLMLKLLPLMVFPLLSAAATAPASVVETKYIDSQVLRENRVGLELRRSLKVYLPPGYAQGKARYPVLYMLHSIGWSNDRMFAPGTAAQP